MRNPLLLDACIAINLLATNHSESIAEALEIHFLMARQAATECECLDIADDKIAVRRQGTEATTMAFADVLSLVDAEIDDYVQLARDIDDGEAATIAIAKSRSLPMATDDRKARRVAVEVGLTIPIGTTSILRRYAGIANLTPPHVAELLQRVRNDASYIPRHTDENFAWWQQAIHLGS
ncbi:MULTISPECIES: hypothetical protein [unclassified Amycolatopsis]|uniref:hypothetical protein n=1 Tax=unclassified Amycolatopsis TaxID=2618356 RepID=UPI0028750DF9|nr:MULTISPECIES: hypothetical protein [unclassified Amycolatopsis]MDS0137557.1 hypothetical protein [Amycolatopsis sp. 505]MDS0141752.1 hypothetical protein [Amycolatopsis sp. CM201R]